MNDEHGGSGFNQNDWQYRPRPQQPQNNADEQNRTDMKTGPDLPHTQPIESNRYSKPSHATGTQTYLERSGRYPEKNPYQQRGNDYYRTSPQPSPYKYHSPYASPYSNPYTPPPPKRRRMKTGSKIALITLAIAVPSICIGVIISALKYTPSDDGIPPNKSPEEYSYYIPDNSMLQNSKPPDVSANPDGPQIEATSTPEESDNEAVTVYNKVSPCVVGIISYPAGTDYTITESGEGSGIIISEDGYIATNSHVVDDSTDTGILVKLSTGEEYIGAVAGIDKRTDLAVVKIDASGLTVAEFADSENVFIGQNAYAIGNPGGLQFSNSLTKGTVSATNRTISSDDPVKYIQTDAAINPGNSGGALINSYGQIIGINTSKLVAEEYEGMGFAIPSNTVISIINNIIKNGYVKGRAYLGITCSEWTTYAAKKNDTPTGVKIESLNSSNAFSGTSAAVGDLITEIDGKKITSLSSLFDIIDGYKPGDKVKVALFRPKSYSENKKSYSYTVTITLLEDTGQ